MKMRMTLFVGLLTFISITAWSQVEIFAPMKDALKAGSAKELVKYFNQSVVIDLDGDERSYSKSQSELVLRDFFKKHEVTEFNILHNGSSPGGLQFAIGKYVSGAENFNVLIRVRKVDNVNLIHEIKFRKD